MPTYVFRCRNCGEIVEKTLSFHDEFPVDHECGGALIKIFQPPHIINKGSGFFSTDQRLYETEDDD